MIKETIAESVADLALTLKDKAIELQSTSVSATGPAGESLRPGDDISKGGVKADDGKARYDLIPVEGPSGVAKVLEYGARKYAPRNWEQGMDWSRPYGAIHRHLAAWWAGEDRDPDTGYSHLWHVATNVFFLIAYESRGRGTDDRPKMG